MNTDPSDIGTYRLRPPIKPLRLAELAALPVDDTATHAVTGFWPQLPGNACPVVTGTDTLKNL